MLTTQQIIDGYVLVFGVGEIPTAAEISFWQALATDGISSADFPQKLASRTVIHQNKSAELIARATTYLHGIVQEEVLRPLANWAEPVNEHIEFKTDILQSRYGLEQRFRLLRKPRITLEYAILLQKADLRHFTHQLQVVQGDPVKTPIWYELVRVPATPLGDWNLNAIQGIRVGKYLLYLSYTKYEIVEVVKIGTSYFFSHPPQMALSSNPWLLPLADSFINENVQLQQLTANVASGRIQAMVEPLTDSPTTFELFKNSKPSGVLRIGDVTVMPFEQNWITPQQGVINRPTTMLDYQIGKRVRYDLHGYSDTKKTLEFFGYKRRYGIRDFFVDCAGRFADFYCPTFTEDLKLVSSFTYTLDQKYLLVTDSGFAQFYAGSKLSKFIYIEFFNHSAIICKIDVPTLNNGLEKIPISAINGTSDPFNFDWTAKEVKRISYLPKWRFDSDSLEISWITPEIYKATATMVTLQ